LFTRWQHQYVSAIPTDTMLRITVKNIHKISTSVCVCITNSYHVAYDSGEYSPDYNNIMCLHFEQIPCYVWQWKIFTKWQHQYVSALRTVTMLLMTVSGTHICLVLSKCVIELNIWNFFLQFAIFSICAQLLLCDITCTNE